MLNPNSKLRRLGRRPSASMVVASLALFMSLTGASYAAVTLSANQVKTVNIHGSAVTNPKIANNAVTYNKIKPSSVGSVRIVKSQVQARLKSTCTTGAITGVDDTGKVTCGGTTLPAETNTAAANPVAVTATTPVAVQTLALAGGSSYLVTGNPYITVTPTTVAGSAAQHVIVTCTLTAGPSTTAVATRSASVDIAASANTPQAQTVSIPLTAAAPTNANASTATVSCVVTSVTATSGGGAGSPAANPATVTAQAPIYALQTGASTIATTTTATTTTTPAA